MHQYVLLQKCAITKVPSVLEGTRKSALFMWKCPFSQYFTMPFLTPGGNTTVTKDLLLWEYTLTGYEESSIGYLT